MKQIQKLEQGVIKLSTQILYDEGREEEEK